MSRSVGGCPPELKCWPTCMESIGDNQYKCTKYGFVIKTTTLPIRCDLCGPNDGTPQDTPPKKTKMPSMTQMAKNFIVSGAQHAANGFKCVDSDELSRRLNICNQCEHHTNGRCAMCGCFLSIKASWGSESCPIGRWGPVLPTPP